MSPMLKSIGGIDAAASDIEIERAEPSLTVVFLRSQNLRLEWTAGSDLFASWNLSRRRGGLLLHVLSVTVRPKASAVGGGGWG
jgi:hypothetical protein